MAEQSQQFSSSVSPLDAVSKVELSISCTNLKDLDVFSKSDPVVFLYEKRGREWQKLGRTEVIDNNLNPKVLLPMMEVSIHYNYYHRVSTVLVCGFHLHPVLKDICRRLSF